MMKPAFMASTALRYTRRPYRWACCAAPHTRGSWDLAPSKAGGRMQRDKYREYREARREREPAPRKPSNNPETLLIRRALDSEDDLLYGVNPVLLALQSGRRPHFTGLFTQIREKSAQKSDNVSSVAKIMKLAKERNIPVYEVSKGSLNSLSKDRPHQGLVLAAGMLPVPSMTTLEVTKEDVWVALDEVTDPHNLGAIIRSAAFLGARGIIVCKRNCCGITPSVCKASAGGVEFTDVRSVASMPRFLRGAKKDGWCIVGLGVDGEFDIGEIDGGGVIVVVGSEGRGMRTMVKEECDKIARIGGNLNGVEGVDSLNVSVATGVALFQLLGR